MTTDRIMPQTFFFPQMINFQDLKSNQIHSNMHIKPIPAPAVVNLVPDFEMSRYGFTDCKFHLPTPVVYMSYHRLLEVNEIQISK